MNIRELLDQEIYPALYERLADALLEFEFKPTQGGWVSNSNTKITGEQGRKGKVYVYENNIGRLIDYTRGSISIWDYVQQRDQLTNAQTLYRLAQLAGTSLPQQDIAPEWLEMLQRLNQESQIWEDAHAFCINCLSEKDNAFALTPAAEQLRQYLIHTRHYKTTDLRLPHQTQSPQSPKMEVGYLPSQEALYHYLIDTKKHPAEVVRELIRLDVRIGQTHTLTVAYRDTVGRIRGLVARNIGNEQPKYLYSTGLVKDDILFNLRAVKGNKDLIVVEGIFDCLLATVRGIPNVVALGGTSFNAKQWRTAQQHGARKITLCLDNDAAGKEATERALQWLTQESVPVYVAELSHTAKDPDEFITRQGADAFAQIIQQAHTAAEYRLAQLFERYTALAPLSSKLIDELLEQAGELCANITQPLEQHRAFVWITQHPIFVETRLGEEYLRILINKYRLAQTEQRQKLTLQKALDTAKEQLEQGNTPQAVQILQQRLHDAKAAAPRIWQPTYTFADWQREMQHTPPALQTGYASLDKIVRIPHGALTLIAGRPSHGKTTVMYNLMLEMCNVYPQQKFYFISLEEQRKYLLTKLLNRLSNIDLSPFFAAYPQLKASNYDFIKAYLRDQRMDLVGLEAGKQQLQQLLEGNRLEVLDQTLPIEEITRLIRYWKQQGSVGAIFIDYIQRLRTERKLQDKRSEMAFISDQLLQVAKDTGVAIVLGAQLNRQSATLGEKRPTLEGLKEAGNLEEDANLVLSIYNESRERELQEDGAPFGQEVALEIKALKNRDGEANVKTALLLDRQTSFIRDSPQSSAPAAWLTF